MAHIKEFLTWIKLKEEIDKESNRPSVRAREIRWCAIGHNIGSEIDGKGDLFARPVIILKMISTNTCLILPLTHSSKEGKYMLEFEFKKELIKARLDQVRIVDIKRLRSKLGELPSEKFEMIRNKTKDFLF